MTLIGHPTELLFDAAKVGKLLAELINSYPDLIWETDSANRSIIHVAVLYRHPSIFNLIHDIGSIKDLLASYTDSENNNILHLAAKVPPSDSLNIVSGAAFQMQRELLWFEVHIVFYIFYLFIYIYRKKQYDINNYIICSDITSKHNRNN